MVIDITIISKDIIALIVARDKPIIVKVTSLQFGVISFNVSNNNSLSTTLRFSTVHPENSGKMLFSIPT